ncbi:hypothetical protein WM40_05045 [Robbsia andropogonis]|uniref:Uncharacterized protein n=1 Tax=Robbsia andropogonis TaxID=28092 RepID=A0A0F5K5C5_9BURK|nr:hypothetical protein WM40_05045 [Robbsia andropogonis]
MHWFDVIPADGLGASASACQPVSCVVIERSLGYLLFDAVVAGEASHVAAGAPAQFVGHRQCKVVQSEKLSKNCQFCTPDHLICLHCFAEIGG